MRVFFASLLALSLIVSASGQALAQASRLSVQGVEPIPGYTGLYVADANRFMAGAFLFVMLTQPRDVRAFLRQVKTCASDRVLVSRLRRERVNTSILSTEEVFTALRSGACDIYIGGNFDLAQLDKRLDGDTGPSDDTRSDPGDDVTPDDDVVADRTPPQIAPVRPIFEGQGRRTTVRARITDDQSAIREAFVQLPGGQRVRMNAAQGSPLYAATVDLPRDFDDLTAFVVATNTANLSARAAVTLRLLQWCGPREVVTGNIVRQVQDGLTCVGFSPGASDGALGPNTCRAIAGYLGGRMDQFNAGRLRWIGLRDELDRACQAAQPVALDVPPRIEVDAPRTRVAIGLSQPGLTASIRVTGPGIGPQAQPWRGQPVLFDLPMPPPGQEAAFAVEAIGPEGTALDRDTLRLIRPPVVLNVRPAGSITVDGPGTDFTATLPGGASAVTRIEARGAGTAPISQPISGGTATLYVPAPGPGDTQRVTFTALDRSGNALARQTVTMTRPAPVLPPRLTLQSPDGPVVDAASARLRLVLENPGATAELVLRSGPDMAVLAGRPVGNGIWDTTQALPPPGREMVLRAQAMDRTGRVLVEDELRIRRAPVALEISPTGRFEADTDSVITVASVTSGADWITSVIARENDGSANAVTLAQSRLADGRARLQVSMPEPGQSLPVVIAAMGRDGEAHATQTITLVRPAAPVQAPVTLRVTSLDGFSVDADTTRLSVAVANPADTATIVVSDPDSGEVLSRAPYAGTDWRGPVKMPAPGRDRALVIEAQNAGGETLAMSQIMLLRPAAPGLVIPPWVWGALLTLAGVGSGYLIAKLRGGRRNQDTAQGRHVIAARPRIFAEPDHEPSVVLDPSSPLTLVMRVDEDVAPRIEVEMEQDEGAET
ncbi:MAG: hypothetical protein AAFP16_02935 [Pseudomonadota bacterium]